jgi:glycosyltransferase involved in cell wall biosynthesis
MAVYNGGELLQSAIESVLNQTLTDFEFIIIDDGSTDDSGCIIQTYAKRDTRIRAFNHENQGLSKSLNRGLLLAQGKYIARQDHDDLSLPERFRLQHKYLEENHECALLGTAAEIWDIAGPTGRYHDHPTENGLLKFNLIFNNPFVHTSIMFRRSIIEDIGFYSTDPMREPPEDFEYFSRIAKIYQISNLQERLVIYREVPGSISSELRLPSSNESNKSVFRDRMALICAENLAYQNSLPFPNNICIDFGKIIHGCGISERNNLNINAIKKLIRQAFIALNKNNTILTEDYRAALEMLYSRYYSFRNLSAIQQLKFIFSGFDEFKFVSLLTAKKIINFFPR